MEQARNILRLVAFLMVAVLVGMGVMAYRFKSSGNRHGGIGRYQNRPSNEEAWKSFDSLKNPTYQALLGNVCAWTPPGMDCGKTLLPSDELHHVLVTFRDPENRTKPMQNEPVKVWASVMQQETDLPLADKLNPKSTLADALVAWNQLSQERQQRQTADSLARFQGNPAPAPMPPPEPTPSSNPQLL
ncbi:MAG: hypothetical protein IPO40_05450 [Fibrobacteres bacterium]|nr:hypothetical protein [Fibrobacterota bacterium]